MRSDFGRGSGAELDSEKYLTTLDIQNLQVPKSFNSFFRLVAKYFTSMLKRVQEALQFLRPSIEEKKRVVHEYGIDDPDKKAIFLTWLIDDA
ncbi:hypothetical protein M422DRAFT_255411 [Sphaerobolus stellatus SS14]|uniref:Uncharacterized protein n=1 Tax=Sphaerobolus stellatus (strain SS14) TaxID=990650 RepID=A0A0C9V3L5_SPHS4|nr:hypothetical protein M422DRAFT_255411 [Sphaerobolus stellatus SS14]